MWDTNCGETIRHQHRIGAKDVKSLFNIVPEAAQYLAHREIESIAKTTVFNCKPDAVCVSGMTAGEATDSNILSRVKQAIPNTLVFANTGVRINTVEEQLGIADGAVVGTTFKQDGDFNKYVELARVKEFMQEVKRIR